MKHHGERKPLRDVKVELARLGASKSQLRQREVAELPCILFEHEEIKAFIIGFYSGGYGMMIASDIRLVFVDVMTFGRTKIDDIPYSMVGSTTLQLGIIFASVTVFARTNTYRFWWLNKKNAHDFSEFVELQMLKHQTENLQSK